MAELALVAAPAADLIDGAAGQDPTAFLRRALAAAGDVGTFDAEAFLARWATGVTPGRNARSQRVYRSHWRMFAQWAGLDEWGAVVAVIVAGEVLSTQAINRHLAEMKGRCSTSHHASRTTVLREMTKFLRFEGRTDWTLTDAIRRPRVRGYRNTAGPGAEALAAMLAYTAEGHTACPPRDLAIMSLLCLRGLRRSEVVAIDVEDVDLAGHRLALHLMKTGERSRVWVPLDAQICDAVAAWTAHPLGPRSGPLFYGIHNGRQTPRLHADTVWRLVKRVGLACGLDLRFVAPHKLRHTVFTIAAEAAGGDVWKLLAFTNHDSITTAQIYVDRMNADQIARHIGAVVASVVHREDQTSA